MEYKRQEAFRYQFELEMPCTITILNKAGTDAVEKVSHGKIIDISPNGLKISTELDIELQEQASFTFTLNQNPITLDGLIIWQNKSLPYSTYGVNMALDKQTRKVLIEELKLYSRGILYIKKQQNQQKKGES